MGKAQLYSAESEREKGGSGGEEGVTCGRYLQDFGILESLRIYCIRKVLSVPHRSGLDACDVEYACTYRYVLAQLPMYHLLKAMKPRQF